MAVQLCKTESDVCPTQLLESRPHIRLSGTNQDVYLGETASDARLQGLCSLTLSDERALTGAQRMQSDPPVGVSACPVADNVMTWYVDSHTSHLRYRARILMDTQERNNNRACRYAV